MGEVFRALDMNLSREVAIKVLPAESYDPAMAWYKEWFGEEYLELYAHRDEGEAARHVGFVARLFSEPTIPPPSVLPRAWRPTDRRFRARWTVCSGAILRTPK